MYATCHCMRDSIIRIGSAAIFYCVPDVQLSVDPFFDLALTSHESHRPAFVVSIIALSVSATTAAHAAEASPNASAQNSACQAVVAISSRERAPAKRAPVSIESFGVDYSRALSPQQMENAYIAAVDDFFHIDHSNETSRTSLRARSSLHRLADGHRRSSAGRNDLGHTFTPTKYTCSDSHSRRCRRDARARTLRRS